MTVYLCQKGSAIWGVWLRIGPTDCLQLQQDGVSVTRKWGWRYSLNRMRSVHTETQPHEVLAFSAFMDKPPKWKLHNGKIVRTRDKGVTGQLNMSICFSDISAETATSGNESIDVEPVNSAMPLRKRCPEFILATSGTDIHAWVIYDDGVLIDWQCNPKKKWGGWEQPVTVGPNGYAEEYRKWDKVKEYKVDFKGGFFVISAETPLILTRAC
jgi:hypothetical protein